MKIKADYTNAPAWKMLTVKATLPEELKCLDEIAHKMWWVWNFEARDLFRDLDPELYHDVKHNPVMLLERLSFARKEEIIKDKALMKRVKEVYALFRKYMDVKPDAKRPSVAYFCMEYGIHSALKIYSGGLGMLAGDYVKEASDSNVDMCAVCFLYRFGYFTQSLSMDGQQIANYDMQNFGSLPIERQLDKDGNPLVVKTCPELRLWFAGMNSAKEPSSLHPSAACGFANEAFRGPGSLPAKESGDSRLWGPVQTPCYPLTGETQAWGIVCPEAT